MNNRKLYRTTVCVCVRVSVTASVCVIVIMNTYTYILCNYWHLGKSSCLFKGGNNCFIKEQSIFLLLFDVLLIFRCLCLLKAGRREQSQFRQIHCTVTYFIVLFLDGNKNAPCFLMYFIKLKTNSTYCKCFWTYSRMEILADFVSVTWLFKVIYLMSLFRSTFIAVVVVPCAVILLKLLILIITCAVQYIDEYMKRRFGFYAIQYGL